jgi:hypothetical protein
MKWMRKVRIPSVSVAFLAVVLGMGGTFAQEKKVDPSRVYGRIQFVTSFPDYRVKVVESFPDLKVTMVTAFPDKPGLWQKVDSFPDYKIQIVDSFPDFTIQWVNSFPGPAK